MPVKKILIWSVVIFVAYYLMTQPTGAGHAIESVLTSIKNAGNSLSKFLTGLT